MAQTLSGGSPFAHGVAVFAGVVLIIGGGFQARQSRRSFMISTSWFYRTTSTPST